MKLILNTILILCLGFFTLSTAITPKETVMINGVKATVWASSELKSKTPGRYSPKNLFDNDTTTGWVEGVEGIKGSHSIFVEFDSAVTVHGAVFNVGYTKTQTLFTQNAVPGDITFEFRKGSSHGGKIEYVKEFNYTTERPMHTGHSRNLKKRMIVFKDARNYKTNYCKIIINDGIAGSKYDDLVISEIAFIGPSFIQQDTVHTPVINALYWKFVSSDFALKNAAEQKEQQFIWDSKKGWKIGTNSSKGELVYEGVKPSGNVHTFLSTLIDSAFYNCVLSVDYTDSSTLLLSPVINAVGDGEFIEAHVELEVYKGNIKNIYTKYHADGAPGCHGVIPIK